MKRFLWLLALAVAGTAVEVSAALASPPGKTVDIDQEAEDALAGPPPTQEADTPDSAQQGLENAPIEPVTPGGQKAARRLPRPPPPNAQPTPILPPGQDYTVKRGDTLWDISGSYLQSPWFWPKLWSYNPQIANPNWIYPGNDIHFYSGGGAQMGNGEGSGQAPMPEMMQEDEVTVQGKIGYVPPRVVLVPVEGFITPKELAEAGRVSGAIGPKNLLTSLDIVYLTFDQLQPKPGEEFVVFRTMKEVYHPVTGDLLGYLTMLRGTVKVTASGPPMYTAEIERSFNTVERGDLVGPYGEKFRRNVARKENDRNLDGYIVATFVQNLVNIGQDHMVFIDRGRRDGVQEGNEFSVLVARDGLEFDYKKRWMTQYPIETIGRLLIVDTKETASEALVVNSSRELEVGDHIQMIAGR
jgi:hypothetical protein